MKTTPASRENYWHYNPSLKYRARSLRSFQTKSEKILWEIVRRKQLYGFAFTRQRPALDYIADFMCKDLLLILEADGIIHETDKQKAYDEKRTLELEQGGFHIMRFHNWEIQSKPEEVTMEIREWIRKKTGITDEAFVPTIRRRLPRRGKERSTKV